MVFFFNFNAHSYTFRSRFQFGRWYLAPLRKGALKYEAPHSPDLECALKWYTNTV